MEEEGGDAFGDAVVEDVGPGSCTVLYVDDGTMTAASPGHLQCLLARTIVLPWVAM